MKNIPQYIFLFFLFILYIGCETDKKDFDEELLLGEWRWSCEMVDESYNNWVYRHSDYEDIKQCRGVETLIFHDDGKFDSYQFFCFPSSLNGNGDWKYDGGNLFLYFNDSIPIVYDVLKLNEKLLIINK